MTTTTAQQFVLTTSTGEALAVERWPAAGPTVVLLHAGVADKRSWTAVGDLLSAGGLDVVAYDRRGFGDSPAAADGTTSTHLEDLIGVRDDLELERRSSSATRWAARSRSTRHCCNRNGSPESCSSEQPCPA